MPPSLKTMDKFTHKVIMYRISTLATKAEVKEMLYYLFFLPVRSTTGRMLPLHLECLTYLLEHAKKTLNWKDTDIPNYIRASVYFLTNTKQRS